MNIDLNGKWSLFVDESNIGIKEKWYSPNWIQNNINSSGEIIEVPSNFNTLKGMDRYNGTVWYFRKLPNVPYRPLSHEYSIEFEGVNYFTEVWINGYKLGNHKGGFLPFRFDFPPKILSLKSPNYLAVKVDSVLPMDGIPSNSYKWFNWGGIHRNVHIILLEKTRVYKIKIKTKIPKKNTNSAIITLDYSIRNPQEYLDRCYLEQIEPQIEYEVYYLGLFFGGESLFDKILIQTGVQYINPEPSPPLNHIPHDYEDIENYFSDDSEMFPITDETINLETLFSQYSREPEKNLQNIEHLSKVNDIDEINEDINLQMKKKKVSIDLNNTFTISVQNPKFWSPETPDLYEIVLRLNGIDEDKQIRFGFREIQVRNRHIFLNNHPIFLKGISLQEELVSHGRYYPITKRREEIRLIKSMGFNAIRAIYLPHNKAFLDIADEEGVLIFEDIPKYSNWDPETLKLEAKNILNLIRRDFNHPSVIVWSIGNEIPVERLEYRRILNFLINLIRKIDPTRLVTFESNRYLIGSLSRHSNTDINCTSLSLGWSLKYIHKLNTLLDMIYWTNRNSPWIISSFGIEAKKGLKKHMKKYSEDYQNHIISYVIRVLNSKHYISGWFLNTYRDFRSPLRKNKYQQGFNRTGIFNEFNKQKMLGRLMNQMIDKKIDSMQNYRCLAPFFSLIFKPFELTMLILKKFRKKIAYKRISKFYLNSRESK